MLTRLIRDRRGAISPLVQLAAVGGMVFLCWYLAPQASTTLVMMLVAGLGGLALIGRLEWGLVLLIPVSLLVPFSVGTGSQTEIPATLLMLAALLGLWVVEMLHRREVRLTPSPANLPWLVLIVVAGLSIVVGDALWNPLVQVKGNFGLVQLGQWSVYIFSAGAFWLTANLVRDTRALRWMVWVFLGLGGVFVGAQALGLGRIAGLIQDQAYGGSLFWVWLAALAAGQALFNRRLKWQIRLALVALLAGWLYITWFQWQGWVSGWGPPLAAVFVVLWLRSGKWAVWTAILGGSVVAAASGYFYSGVILTALRTGSFLRLPAWKGIIDLVGRRWPIGLGLAAYYHYWRDVLGVWEWSPTNIVRLTGNVGVPSHSNYVDFYGQMGVLGIGVFLWLAAALVRQGWQAAGQVQGDFERAYINGCLGGLAGTLAAGFLADWFLPFVYNIGLGGMRASVLGWLFLGGMVALARIQGMGGQQTVDGK